MLRIVLILYFNKILFIFACDLFVASKCPSSPATNDFNVNSTAYCKNIKDHVDCINKKLKFCKNVQEFGPALETIKWSLKVTIMQGSDHGCADLADKIKLPRIPRKKMSTTTIFIPKEKDQIFIDANCNRKVIDMNCEKLDSAVMKYLYNDNSYNDSCVVVNDANCKQYTRYNTCMQQNFRVRCQQTLKQVFYKLEKMTSTCGNLNILHNYKIKHKPAQSDASTNSNMKSLQGFILMNAFFKIFF